MRVRRIGDHIRDRIAGRIEVFDPDRIPVVVVGGAEAVQIAAVSIHHPDLSIAGTIGPENELGPIRRPGRVAVDLRNKGIFADLPGVVGFIAFCQLPGPAAGPNPWSANRSFDSLRPLAMFSPPRWWIPSFKPVPGSW